MSGTRRRTGRLRWAATGLCLEAGIAGLQWLPGGSGDGRPTHIRTTGRAEGGVAPTDAPAPSAPPGPEVVTPEGRRLWDAVEYPLDCRDAGPPYVVETTYGQSPTGTPPAIARVACTVGGRDAPHGAVRLRRGHGGGAACRPDAPLRP